MKNFIKQSIFLVLITCSLVFASCESNEEVLPTEEQNLIERQFNEVPQEPEAAEKPVDSWVIERVPEDNEVLNALIDLRNKQLGKTEHTIKVSAENSLGWLGTITLKGSNGRYVSSENGNKMTCKKTSAGNNEKFDFFIDLDNYRYYLQTYAPVNGYYNYVRKVTSHNYLKTDVAFSSATGFLIDLFWNGPQDPKWAFKAPQHRNLYLSRQGHKKSDNIMTLDRQSAGSWEKFELNYVN